MFSETEASTASSASCACCTDIPPVSASSSTDGSRPCLISNCWRARRSLLRRSSTCTGIRIVFDWFATARWQAWRIHHVAYVENLKPLRQSNFSAARLRPMTPS